VEKLYAPSLKHPSFAVFARDHWVTDKRIKIDFFSSDYYSKIHFEQKRGGCKSKLQKKIVWLSLSCCEDSLDKGGYREWKVFEHWELETPHRRFRQNRGWPTLWPCNSHLVANQQKELKSNCKLKLLCSITHVSICKDCSFLVTGKMKSKMNTHRRMKIKHEGKKWKKWKIKTVTFWKVFEEP